MGSEMCIRDSLLTGVASSLIRYLLNHEFGVVSISGILIGAYLVCLTILVITLMSVERWLHMTRRSLVTSQYGYLFAVLSLLAPVPLVTLQALNLTRGKMEIERNAAMGAYGLSCYLATSVAYFKVFRIIRQHQQQIHGIQSRQNFGEPAIDLAKYKKSIFSILYILALFSLCVLPFIVSLFLLFFWVRITEVRRHITYLWCSYFQRPVSILVFIFGE